MRSAGVFNRYSGTVSLAIAVTLLAACSGTCSANTAVRVPSPSAATAAPSQAVTTPATGSCPAEVPSPSSTNPSTATPPPLATTNLINNPGADADAGAPSNNEIVNPSGWTVRAGQPTAVQYGADGGFPGPTDPGPTARGANFFSGGNVACSELTQVVDLSSRATDIDASKASFVLSGWLGGFSAQDDFATVTLTFGPAPSNLGSFQIGPVLQPERQGQTGLFYRAVSGTVPSGARTATIVIQMTRFEGTYDDGSADSLALQLGTTA